MKIMNLQSFCEAANSSELIAGKYVVVTKDLLKEIGFAKKEYYKADIFQLSFILKEKKKERYERTEELILTPREQKAFESLIEVLYPEAVLRLENKREHYSLVTVFRLVPKVNDWIIELRQKFNIDPEKVKEEIHHLYPNFKEKVDWMIESQREFNQETFDNLYKRLGEEKWEQIKKQVSAETKINADIEKGIRNLIAARFPNLKKEVNKFRITLKLPLKYTDMFLNYVVFNRIDAFDKVPSEYASRLPEVRVINKAVELLTDTLRYGEDNFDPFISLKIFGDSSRRDVEMVLDYIYSGKNSQPLIKTLPSYNFKAAISNPKLSEENLVRNAICYFLSEKHELAPKEIRNVFKRFNKTVDANTINRNVLAFKQLLKI